MTAKAFWSAASAGVLALAAVAAHAQDVATDPAVSPAEVASPKYGTWGFDLSGEETKTPPGQDFFRYANGAWFDHEQIPADRTRFGNFDRLAELSEDRMHLLVEEAAAGRSTDPDAAKVGDAYKAFMDETRVERLDAQPLAADLDAIRGEQTRADIAATTGHVGSFQVQLFGPSINADAKSPTRYAVYLGAGGLGLPDRDYYLRPQFAEKKAAYQAYVAKMLDMVGWADPQASANAVVEFESQVAEASWTRAERRDRDKTYNPMTLAELTAYAPGFDFAGMLDAADLGHTGRLIVTTNTAFPKIAAVWAATPVDTLKAWQAFHLADNASPYLSDRFVEARFAFRDKTLGGQPELEARWKRGVEFVDSSVGESLGRMYVARYFTPEAKAKIDALVSNIRTALAARIQKVDWMSPQTKAKAEAKLAKFTVKIGYPDKWRDYSALQINAMDLFGDAERSEAYEWARQVKRMNGPVDKAEWGMHPQRVNAYYNYANNEIVFPAAILQPPFFDPDADPAINYGGVGGVIGHEMTHGFDDQGRKSDGDGLLTDWWTPADAAQFKVQADRLGAQYSQFEPVPGTHVKGELTMGENIADLGGVLLALDAYHASLHGKPAPVIDGLTGDQRVFLGWAQVWREKIRDDRARQLAVSDPHSPAHFRVIGPLRNIDAWYRAFDIKPTDPLYLTPDQRVRLW
jgi:putative endopeptidase